jgi:3-oxoacyl-[acyl-carrier protein] reductase
MNIGDASILITGAGGDLGCSLVQYFMSRAANVIAVDINTDTLIRDFGSNENVTILSCNLTKSDEIIDAFDSASIGSDVQEPNILINNAGLIHSELMFDLFNPKEKSHKIETWNSVISANLDTTFMMSRFFVERYGSKRKGSLILNMSSVSARGMSGQSAYAAAKAGIEALTKSWAKELSGLKIRANAIAPGFIDTHSTHKSLSEAKIKEYKRHTPSGRLGKTDEVCKIIQHVIENDFLNGQILGLDGGFNVL